MTGPLIGTHNGHFHADEALAVYMLRLLPEYADSNLVRTRDPATLDTCHTVVDVGGVYEHVQKRYDHHQREFNTVFPGSTTKLSSAGLVYMHHGKLIIKQIIGADSNNSSDADIDLLYQKLYDDFIEAFDANDNGISAVDASDLRKAGLKKRFNESRFTLASVVSRFNNGYPAARRRAETTPVESQQADKQAEEDSRFAKASQFVGEQFVAEVSDKHHSWLPARGVVKEAFEARKQYDQQGRIMVVPHRPEGVPWADHLYALETEADVRGQVLYVLFAESGEADSKWRVRAVSVQDGGFENRKDLPAAWKGVRDEELSKVSGVPGCIFVHAGGFIGGNKTFDGALQMAKKALDM